MNIKGDGNDGNTEDKLMEEQKEEPKEEELDEFDMRVHMKLTKKEIKCLDKLEEYEKITWMVESSNLCTGSSFGEKALTNNER